MSKAIGVLTRNSARAAVGALLLCLTALACSEGPAPLTAPSDEACASFGEAFAKAANTRDVERFYELLDAKAIVAEAVRGLGASKQQRAALLSQFRQQGFGARLFEALGANTRFAYLRTLTRADGAKLALFRMIQPVGGVNYVEATLSIGAGASARAVELTHLSDGDSATQSLRRDYLQNLYLDPHDTPKGLNEAERALFEHFDQYMLFVENMGKGKDAEALVAWRSLPEAAVKDKALMLKYVALTGRMEGGLFDKAVESYEALYPADVSLALVSMDHRFKNDDIEEVLESIDEIDKALGGDPYLNVLRASALIKKGEYDAASNAAKRALEAAPERAQTMLLVVALKQKRFEQALEMLEKMEHEGALPPQFRDMGKVPLFSEFVKTPQYAKWLNAHSKKTVPIRTRGE